MKLTKAEYDALPEQLKGLYKADGDHYVPTFLTAEQHEEQVSGLKANNEKLVNEKRETTKKAQEAEAARKQAEEDAARKAGDVAAIDKSWGEKFEALKGQYETGNAAMKQQIHDLTAGATTTELATKIFGKNAHLGKGFVASRITAEQGEDGKWQTRILGADGKPSALTADELIKEFQSNPEYAAIVEQAPSGITPKTPPQSFKPGATAFGGGDRAELVKSATDIASKF